MLATSLSIQASRFPDATFPSVKLLLGHSSSDPSAKLYETVYRTKLYSNATSGKAGYSDSTIVQDGSDHSLRWPEEYLAMQFNHAKKLAKEAAGGENIVDTVVTVRVKLTSGSIRTILANSVTQVPIFYTQAERQSILDALEIAGLKPLALLDDGSAGQYCLFKTFCSTQLTWQSDSRE